MTTDMIAPQATTPPLHWGVVVVVPTVGFVYRIRVEERALLDGLGEPYRRFAADRARLIPGQW